MSRSRAELSKFRVTAEDRLEDTGDNVTYKSVADSMAFSAVSTPNSRHAAKLAQIAMAVQSKDRSSSRSGGLLQGAARRLQIRDGGEHSAPRATKSLQPRGVSPPPREHPRSGVSHAAMGSPLPVMQGPSQPLHGQQCRDCASYSPDDYGNPSDFTKYRPSYTHDSSPPSGSASAPTGYYQPSESPSHPSQPYHTQQQPHSRYQSEASYTQQQSGLDPQRPEPEYVRLADGSLAQLVPRSSTAVAVPAYQTSQDNYEQPEVTRYKTDSRTAYNVKGHGGRRLSVSAPVGSNEAELFDAIAVANAKKSRDEKAERSLVKKKQRREDEGKEGWFWSRLG